MNINDTMKELAQYIRLQEEAAQMVDTLKEQVKAYMLETGTDTITGDEHKATYKDVTASRIDTTALKRERPDIAQQYTKQTKIKRFLFV